jgi:two-component system, cell cycle response regulator
MTLKSSEPSHRATAPVRRQTHSLPKEDGAAAVWPTNRRSSRPGPRNHAVLFALTGPQQGAVLQIHGTSLWLGRGTVDLSIDDDAISSRHAHLTRRADGVYVRDNGSRNGTFVNDERIEASRRLDDGDHLSVGNTILKFSMLDELEEHALTQLVELTIRDPLTRAYNRRYLTDHLRSEVAFAARQGMPLGVLLVDIDHFKHVNDSYGHAVGDVVLQLVATSIQRMLRPYDVLCRYGGEEFVVLARASSPRNTEILAERIRHSVEAMRFDVAGRAASVTVSVGVAAMPAGAVAFDAEFLLQAADEALYAAKESGRNRVRTSRLKASRRSARDTTPLTSPPAGSAFAAGSAALDCRPPPLPRFD